MSLLTPARLPMLLCLVVPLAAQSPQRLAPTAQTQIPATPLTTAAPATSSTPAPPPVRRARITYTGNQLTIRADNSSLNQILHEISQITGITITGGVAEERVFGNYGPAALSEVLGQLLDGTSSNMLFIASTGGKAPQLILTPQNGGPTPPSPNTARYDDNSTSASVPLPPAEPALEPSIPVPPPGPPSAADTNNSPAHPESGSSPQSSSSGVKTPQQIYDELIRLRQQQQQKQ